MILFLVGRYGKPGVSCREGFHVEGRHGGAVPPQDAVLHLVQGVRQSADNIVYSAEKPRTE